MPRSWFPEFPPMEPGGGEPTIPPAGEPPAPGPTPEPEPEPELPPTTTTPTPTHPIWNKGPKRPVWHKPPKSPPLPGGPTEPPEPTDPIVPSPEQPLGPYRTDVFVPTKEPLPVIYGEVGRVGAQVWYDKVQLDGSRLVLYAVCHGEINSISNITIEDVTLASLNLAVSTHYNVYTGTSGQAVDPLGAAAEPTTWTSGMPFVAYVVIRFPRPSATQPAPDVKRFLCDVQGMKVRDPRTDATLVTRYYRNNVALCVADFMSSPSRTAADGSKYTYGAGNVDAALDWTGTVNADASVTAAANNCDVLLADGVTKRFTIGWVINETRNWRGHIDDMRVHAQMLFPQWNGGVWQFPMDIAQSASGITLTDVGVGAQIVTAGPLTVRGAADVYTDVVADFINPAAAYKDEEVNDAAAGIALGTVSQVRPPSSFRFGAIPFDQSKRLCRYIRKRSLVDKEAPLYLLNDGGIRLLPGMRIAVTSAQLNWSAQDVIVTSLKSSRDPRRYAWVATVAIYDAAVYDDTQASATPYAPPANPSPYGTPPEVVRPVVTVGSTTSPATVYFDAPQNISTTLYGTGFFTQSGLASYDGTKVNDGITSATAFVSGAGDSLTFDAGVGLTKSFDVCDIYTSAFTTDPTFERSDDMAAWTTIFCYPVTTQSMGGGITKRSYIFQFDPGARRGWRLKDMDATVTEVHYREFTGEYAFAESFRIYNMKGGTRRQYGDPIRRRRIPTSTEPVDIDAIATHVGLAWNVAESNSVDILITTVSSAGVESNGVRVTLSNTFAASGGASPYVTQTENSLALANGDNGTITLAAGPGLTYITGPTSSFSIKGITAMSAGTVGRLFNATVQPMTIQLENAGASAANRIYGDGVSRDIIVGGLEIVELEYSASFARWILKNPHVLSVLYERGRATPVGEGYAFADVRTASAGTWTASAPFTNEYALIGKLMFFVFCIDNTTVSNAGVELRLTIPGGFLSAAFTQGKFYYQDAGGAGLTGEWYTTGGGNTINLRTAGFGNFAIAAANTSIRISGMFRIQ